MRSRASARPCGSAEFDTHPRLFVLLHRKTGPHSHHWSHVGGLPPANRMPSGLRTPSILMTSAPNDANTWVATGPAQKAVKSATLIPDSGRASARAGPCGSSSRGSQCTRPRVARPGPEASPAHGGRSRNFGRAPGANDSPRGFDEDATLDEVVDLHHRCRSTDGRDRDAQRHGQLEDLVSGAGFRPPRNHGQEFVAASHPPGHRRKLFVVEKVRPIDQHQEVLKLLSGDRAEPDHPVGRRHDRWQLETALSQQRIAAEHARRHRGQAAHRDDHRLVDRYVDHRATTGAARVTDRGRGHHGGECPCQPLTDAASGLQGFRAGPAATRDRAAQRLKNELVGYDLLVDVWARGSERRYRDYHRRQPGARPDVVK